MKISFRHLIVTFILYLFIINSSFSQNKAVIDSLLVETKKTKSDKEKIDTYLLISAEYKTMDLNISESYVSKAIKLAEENQYVEREIDALSQLGFIKLEKKEIKAAEKLFEYIYKETSEIKYDKGLANSLRGKASISYFNQKFETSIEYYNKSLEISKKINAKEIYSNTLFEITTVLTDKGEFKKALKYYMESKALFEDLDDKLNLGNVLNGLGATHSNLGNYKQGIGFYSKAIELRIKINDKKGLSLSYSNLGHIYDRKGDYKKALDFYYKAREINEEIGERKMLLISYDDIASIYRNLGEYDKAKNYHLTALKIAKELDNNYEIASININLGNIYEVQEKYDQALILYKKAHKIFVDLKIKRALVFSYGNISSIYEKQGKDDESLKYALKSLQICEEINSKNLSPNPMLIIGSIYLKKNKLKEAKYYFTKSLNISSEVGEKLLMSSSAEYLTKTEKKLGNYKKALEHYEFYTKLSDSLSSDKLIGNMAKMEAEHAYKKQKDSIQFVNVKEKMELNQTIQKQKMIQYLTMAGIAILFVILYILYRYYKSKKEANKLLNKQRKEIIVQRDELVSLDKQKSMFFANISHELRTPITLIKGPVDYISEKEGQSLSRDVKKHLQLIKRNTNKLSNLVDDILDLSKLEANKIEVYLESTDLSFFITRVFESYRSLTDQIGITYILTITIPDDTFVMLDKSKTEKILNNLLSNAIKHTPENGNVNLNCSVRNNTLDFQIQDTGSGIPKKDLPFIFDRYFQSKQPDAPIQGGTGIGLSLAKEYVKLLNGKINVESIVGLGSTFTLLLPYTIAQKVKDPNKEVELSYDEEDNLMEDIKIRIHKNSKANHRVLIVEDQPELLRFLKTLLEDTYQVAIAMNGKQALRHLSKNSVDLIISDVMMPEMNGFELLKAVRDHKLHQSIPIIMLTALGDEANKLEALSMGVDDYLAKPFIPKELITRVENMLARYSIRKEQEESEVAIEEGVDANSEGTITTEGLGKGKVFIQKVEKRMIQELENEEFSIEKMAEEFFLSHSQFRRKTKQYTGLSPKQLQREISMQKARDLLETRQYGNLTAVAHSVGIRNVTRFSKFYEERFGKKPSDYFLEIDVT